MDIGVFFTSRRIGFLISLERMLEMRIAICDDNALDRALIMDLLQQYLEDRSIRCELTGYEDGVTLGLV